MDNRILNESDIQSIETAELKAYLLEAVNVNNTEHLKLRFILILDD